MRGKWLRWVRQIHTWLGVFFSPLLLLFAITGWWQTFMADDAKEKEKTFLHAVMARLSTVHTDDYFPRSGGSKHASEYFKFLVSGMAGALILTIILGLILSFQTKNRVRWIILALALGILVPAILLRFS